MFSALFNYVFIYYGINERKSSWSEVYSTKSHDKVLIGKKNITSGKITPEQSWIIISMMPQD